MKLRIVQDHDAACQPWFRLEQYLEPSDSWYIVTSGPDHPRIKARLEKMALSHKAEHEITVLEEREV